MVFLPVRTAFDRGTESWSSLRGREAPDFPPKGPKLRKSGEVPFIDGYDGDSLARSTHRDEGIIDQAGLSNSLVGVFGRQLEGTTTAGHRRKKARNTEKPADGG